MSRTDINMRTGLRRYAFISYNHKDAKWAKWLQEKLESYKLPADIFNEFEDSRYLRPIFRDKTDLNTGVLANELKKELEESKYLIVICSPNSAKSAWVSDEVKAFIEMGRLDYIIPFIVSGTPHNYSGKDCESPYNDECVPLFLRQYTQQNPELELLGVSTDEVGKEKALIRVVSRMLGVSFDVLWKRHERQKTRHRIIAGVSAGLFIASLISIWVYSQPFDAKITYEEKAQNPALPFVDGSIKLLLENDTLEYSVVDLSLTSEFKNIPRKYHKQEVEVIFDAYGYHRLDTLIILEPEIALPVCRKTETYGLVRGIVLDMDDNPVCNVQVSIMEYSTKTDRDGAFSILIPLAKQLALDIGYSVKIQTTANITEEKVYSVGDNNICNTLYIP